MCPILFSLMPLCVVIFLCVTQQEAERLHSALKHSDNDLRLMAFSFLASSQRTTGVCLFQV